MHQTTDHGFNCSQRGSMAPTEFWTVEIKLRGEWTPTDAFGWTEADIAGDLRTWRGFYRTVDVRAVKRSTHA